MKRMTTIFTVLMGATWVMAGGAALAEDISFEDPKGDDDGPGKYTYPTDAVYKKGSFDMTGLELEDKGDTVEVSISFKQKIEDAWDSKAWDGNGFSLQMAFIFIDTDHKAGSGHKDALPGLNVTFDEASRWEKVLIISAQGNARVESEVNLKAKALKADIVLPTSVSVRGRKIVARYKKSDIGGLEKSWGYQALVQSNEGYPDKTDLLTRKVNEFGGQHRFGGGSDYDCDPHVIDMLAGLGKGDSSEKAAQHKALSTYKCGLDGSGTRAEIPMVYP